MASSYYSVNCTPALVLLGTLLSSLQYSSVSSTEFQVGDAQGWGVPPSTGNDTQFYNQWASKYNFHVGDTIRFKYEKDSVMLVSEQAYNKCNSTHPSFFSNSGNTIFKLGYAGPFYFMSGAAGHCGKGQRMVIVVLENENGSPPDHHDSESSGTPSAVSLVRLSHRILFSLIISSYFLASHAFDLRENILAL